MGLREVLDHPAVYRLWQAPFARAKLRPLLSHNDLGGVRRVLDVGCGPGTNAALFTHCDYLGLDLNERYIEYARSRYHRPFAAVDVRTYVAPAEEKFDFVLLNSLLHHLDDRSVRHILLQVREQLVPGGCVHILDLVLPARRSVARWLALADRGDYPRPLERWQELFAAVFEPLVVQSHGVGTLGLTLWSMVYFKGRSPA